MELIVDLHIHSKYSRATSRQCDLEGLYRWGKIKGINIIGTGDFTHPAWLTELQAKLEPAESGLYKLKDEYSQPIDATLPATVVSEIIRFVPTVEIATIYSKGGKVRKIHQLLVAPSLAAAADIQRELAKIGNLAADGRPILGMDSKVLLQLMLRVAPDGLYIPAHIWTPWFGLFGSKSGFDTLEEAYEELTPHIRAVETGLSSDPAMNWRLSQLRGLTLTSHSDAHSPQKLGREATVVQANVSCDDIVGAIRTNDDRLVGTIEFFPEEGKYHADGHRLCNVRLAPAETRALGGLCPRCAKPLVVGVDYRVGELADIETPFAPKQTEYIVPLNEIMAEIMGLKSANGKKVMAEYHRLIAHLGSEFAILRHVPLAQIEEISPALAHALGRMRAGEVQREPGFDGVYGTITLLAPEASLSAASL